MKVYNAAVIGLGFIGPQHMDAINRVPQARIAAVCDANPQAAQAAAEAFGVEKWCTDWRELVEDPSIDVIHNCTPHFLHDEINRAAMNQGKHVYCEKPLSLTTADAREMVHLAEEKGVAVGLNHQYRLNAAVQEMRARLQKGLAGKPLVVWGRYLQQSAARQRDYSPKMENTGLARAINDIGIHWADTACCVLGQPIVSVMAELITHYPNRVDEKGVSHPMSTEDTGLILCRFADGTRGELFASKACNGHMNDLRLAVSCEEYEMQWLQEEPDQLRLGINGEGEQVLHMNPKTVQPETLPYISTPMGHVMGWPDALRNAVRDYYDSITKGTWRNPTQPYATFRDGFAGCAFVEACLKSNQEKKWVDLEQL